jgi:hypothetical protein
VNAKLGRPPLSPDKRHIEVVRVSLTPTERATLEQLAGSETMAAAIRRLLAEQGEKK